MYGSSLYDRPRTDNTVGHARRALDDLHIHGKLVKGGPPTRSKIEDAASSQQVASTCSGAHSTREPAAKHHGKGPDFYAELAALAGAIADARLGWPSTACCSPRLHPWGTPKARRTERGGGQLRASISSSRSVCRHCPCHSWRSCHSWCICPCHSCPYSCRLVICNRLSCCGRPRRDTGRKAEASSKGKAKAEYKAKHICTVVNSL